MAILGCARCHTPAPTKATDWTDDKGRGIGEWWHWSHGEYEDAPLMVCPDCILQLLHDDMERTVS